MRYLTSLISLVLLLSSCEDMQTVIDLELPPHQSKLVVNSSNKVDDKFKVYVSHSLDPLSNEDFEFHSDATVILFENQIAIDTLTFIDSSRFYKSNVRAELDISYSIQVNHPNYPLLNSKSLNAPPVTEIESVNHTTTSTSGNVTSFIELEFDDNVLEENFYLLKLVSYTHYLNENGEPQVISTPIYFESSDPSLTNGSNGFDEEYGRKVMFNDQLFNGQTKRIELSYDNYYYEEDLEFGVESESKIDSIEVNLSTLDFDYYTYHTTNRLQNNTSGGAIFGSEPVNVYNSFTNDDGSEDGYGLFSIISKDTFMLKLD
jgi:hypothetical protein